MSTDLTQRYHLLEVVLGKYLCLTGLSVSSVKWEQCLRSTQTLRKHACPLFYLPLSSSSYANRLYFQHLNPFPLLVLYSLYTVLQ